MRAIQVYEVGGPEVLREAEVAPPRPGPGEAVVEVAASGVNFLDVYHREGRYSLPLPFTPGTEGAGTVVGIGPGVTDVAVGDRVGWVEIPGSYAEQAVVDSSRLVPLPDDIDFETAAAVLLQGMTAHYLVKDAYPVRESDTVLVHAAAGGMGLLLTQLVTHLGGRVIGTTSTTAKAELAKRAGAAEVVLSSAVDDLAAEVRRLNGGRGLPVVFDGVGAHTFDASLASLRTRGHLVLFGAASGAVPPFDPMRLAQGGSLTLIRPSLGDFIADRPELLRRAAEVFAWVRSKALEVTVTGRYALSEAARAHSDLEARRTTGKLLLVPDAPGTAGAAAGGRREEPQS
ncbi:quinone oxidoreductase family protein [Streptomyces sp. NPDC090085]|uniref:quinone oxidoreductase family protein n=1 Tax=Streptomyces sp. NPDC090085 TaxID=3365943 RepID=UPI0038157A47